MAMDTTTIFLFFVFACLGVALGAILASARQRRPPPAPGGTEPPALPDGSLEVLRVWRTGDTKLRLGMDGQQLANANELQPEQRRRLVKLVVDLRPWLETPSAASAQQPAGRTAAPQPKTAAVTAEDRPAAPVLKSIIEQIDDVLQAKLAGSTLQSRDIHLTEGPGGVVVVKIGLNKYEGIESVPEAEIQTLIRQAVAEWEKSAK
jgi:hypothetical protein